MFITRTSQWSGITRTIDLNVSEEQITKWLDGELIQDAMPQLTQAEREFIMTGMTEEEWNEIFNDDEEE